MITLCLCAVIVLMGSALVGRLANPCVLTRPNRVCLRCGSWVRSSGASASRVSPPAARLLHVE